MLENGFYNITQNIIDKIALVGGYWHDKSTTHRPVFCCIEDEVHKGLYWAIPASLLDHRTPDQIAKYERYKNLPDNDIRKSYYYVGKTDRPCVYRISNCFPITDKYIERQYISQGKHLILQNPSDIAEIRTRLKRILAAENRKPNTNFEQHITALKELLIVELSREQENKPSVKDKLKASIKPKTHSDIEL